MGSAHPNCIDMISLLVVSLLVAGSSAANQNRDGKFFFVSSSTATVSTTTTSVLSTKATCYAYTKDAIVTCPSGRKRRSLLKSSSLTVMDPLSADEEEIKVSRVQRDVNDGIDFAATEEEQNRDARFFWYYMTTTTTTSITGTYTVTLTGCTPTISLQGCGK